MAPSRKPKAPTVEEQWRQVVVRPHRFIKVRGSVYGPGRELLLHPSEYEEHADSVEVIGGPYTVYANEGDHTWPALPS